MPQQQAVKKRGQRMNPARPGWCGKRELYRTRWTRAT